MVRRYDRAEDPKIKLADAKTWLKLNHRPPGAVCPCCNQLVVLRKRNFNSTMGRTLLLLYREHTARHGDWVHVERLLKRVDFPSRGDFYKLKHWGLIEGRPASRSGAYVSAGYFRITKTGVRFALCRLRLPSFAWVLQDDVYAWSPVDVNIRQVLGRGFDYDKFMKGC